VNINNYVEKLRALPDKQKKIILWTVVVVLGLVMSFFWFKISMERFEKMEESIKKTDIPSIDLNIEGNK